MQFNHILMVCVGNICRSPMAEVLMRHSLRNNTKVQVSSAGLAALSGYPADPKAVELLTAKGLDASEHRATQLNSDMIRHADLILVMEKGHKLEVERIDPTARGKLFRIGKWHDFDVPDPYQGSMEAFQESLVLIEKGINSWMDKIQ